MHLASCYSNAESTCNRLHFKTKLACSRHRDNRERPSLQTNCIILASDANRERENQTKVKRYLWLSGILCFTSSSTISYLNCGRLALFRAKTSSIHNEFARPLFKQIEIFFWYTPLPHSPYCTIFVPKILHNLWRRGKLLGFGTMLPQNFGVQKGTLWEMWSGVY